MRIGTPELLVILAIVIVLFGAKRLPELGSGLAKSIKGFRQGIADEDKGADKPEGSEPTASADKDAGKPNGSEPKPPADKSAG